MSAVCVSVCPTAYHRNHMSAQTSPNFLLPVARFSSDDKAICYALPVAWMTLRFHTTTAGIGDANWGTYMLKSRLAKGSQHPGGKYDVYDFLSFICVIEIDSCSSSGDGLN